MGWLYILHSCIVCSHTFNEGSLAEAHSSSYAMCDTRVVLDAARYMMSLREDMLRWGIMPVDGDEAV
jgi:hypothetical protein